MNVQPVNNTIPVENEEPTACEKIWALIETVGVVAAFALAISAMFYSIGNNWNGYISGGLGGLAALFAGLVVLHCSCGKGKVYERLHSLVIRQCRILAQQQVVSDTITRQLGEERGLIVRMRDLQGRTAAAQAELNGAIDKGDKIVGGLNQAANGIRDAVAVDVEAQNAIHAHLGDLARSISGLDGELKEAKDLVPALQKLDLSMGKTAQECQDKILSAFKQLLSQVTSFAQIIKALETRVTELDEKCGQLTRQLQDESTFDAKLTGDFQAAAAEVKKWKDEITAERAALEKQEANHRALMAQAAQTTQQMVSLNNALAQRKTQ